MTAFVRVALPVHLDRLFDYLPGEFAARTLSAGIRVRVPFRNRKLIGVVTELASHSEWPVHRLRPVVEVLDRSPLLPASTLELCGWIARYYHYPLGEVIAMALPKLLREGGAPERSVCWQVALTDTGRALEPASLARAPRQRDVLEALNAGSRPRAELMALPGINGQVLKRMEGKSWLSIEPIGDTPFRPVTAAPKLNEQQHSAATAVIAALGGFRSFLLDGVTGSGKTEVYLKVIEQVVERGRQSLLIVPEIGLTPQLMARFRERLGDAVGVLHSGMTDRERHDIWLRAASGELDVLLGTRSAIFAPLPKLGLIIVDEEHDNSLKQQDGLRYSARDVAVQRAKMAGVPVVLGSATPSLESLNNALSGRYQDLVLERRAGGANPPSLERIDLRGQHCDEGVSGALVAAMAEHLARGEQVMLFLNRRGFSPVLMCNACGWNAECPRCDARMTLHLSERRLRCHHCDRQQAIPTGCPSCDSSRLEPLGLGTRAIGAGYTKVGAAGSRIVSGYSRIADGP
jgi:primosomal protein N' (replication factor Y)